MWMFVGLVVTVAGIIAAHEIHNKHTPYFMKKTQRFMWNNDEEKAPEKESARRHKLIREEWREEEQL